MEDSSMTQTWEKYEQVYTQATFFEALKADIALAKSRVVLYSPFLTLAGIERLESAIIESVRRMVACCIFMERPREWDDRDNVAISVLQRAKLKQTEIAVRTLEALGAHVNMLPRIHEKLAIIDHAILYDGSLNILSWNSTNERMTRFLDPLKALDSIEQHQIYCKFCTASAKPENLVINASIVGNLIAERRVAAGISIRQLANRVGVGRKAIYDIEAGRTMPNLDTFIRIANHLDRELLWMPPQAVQNVTRVVTSHLK